MDKKRWERINDLFHDALDCEESRRSAFLDEACRDDPALRVEVEALLANDSSADEFLETPASITGAGEDSEESYLGRRIGQYILQRVVSSGGMGTVYEALQENPRRIVALKMMREGIASRSALRRFEYESQVLARLRHPGIAQIFEAGMHQDVPFFVMEYIPDARSVTEHARQEKLGTRERLYLYIQVCEAVHHGHQKGIIHRDLKPANILVDAQGQVKIIDFGIARAADSDPARTAMQTGTGQLIGTVQYMSPEQCGDDPQDLDVRSDVYTLGVVLYELLCGRMPYELRKAGLYETIRAIREEEPARPGTSCRSLRGDLETVILKALNKDRKRRYQSASGLAVDIRRFLAREPIDARRDSALYVIKKKLMRRPVVTVLAALAILISITAGMFAYRSHLDRVAKRSAEGQRALDQALVEALCGRYDQVEPWLEKAEINEVYPGRISMLRGMAALESGKIQRAIPELSLAVEQLPESLGAYALLLRAYLFTGQFDKVVKVSEIMRTLEPSTIEDYLYGGWTLGVVMPELSLEWLEHAARERPTPAVQLLLGNQRFFVLLHTYDPEYIDLTVATLFSAKTQTLGSRLSVFLLSFGYLAAADIYRLRKDPVRSNFYLDKAKEEARSMMEDHGEHAYSREIAGFIALYENRLEEALHHFRTAVTLPGSWPLNRFWLPFLLYRLGRFEEALAELNAMPDPFKVGEKWCMATTFVTAEVHGIEAAKACYQDWHNKYGRLFRPFGRDLEYNICSFLGRHQDAVRSNKEYIQRAGPPITPLAQDPFKIAVDRYVCGEQSAEDFLRFAKKRFQRMHGDYLIGLTFLSEGNRDEAMRRFAAVEAAGNIALSSDFSGARWAYAFLPRLREDPDWPRWIPVMADSGQKDE